MGLYSASKAVILVNDGPEPSYLLSAKRDPGSLEEGKLEFPGGRLEVGEPPLVGLLRELSEEEQTGNLALLARARATLYFPLLLGEATYFLFPFHLSAGEFDSLTHDPEESFGFELVRRSRLVVDPTMLTRKTNIVLESLIA